MITNAFRATLADDTPVGLCFEPILALANHSCSPNAVVVFDGRSVALRAMRVIRVGEQVFISYITASEDRLSRQMDLKQRYFFNCKCEKCSKDEIPKLSLPRREAERVDLLYWDHIGVIRPRKGPFEMMLNDTDESVDSRLDFSKVNSYFQQSQQLHTDPAAKQHLLKQAAKACASETKRFYLHPMPKIMHELYLSYLDNSSYLSALVILLFTYLNCDVYNYHQSHHPVRVVKLFTIAKLLKHLSSLTPEDLKLLAGDANRHPELHKAIKDIDWINSFHAVLLLVWEQAPKSHGKGSGFMTGVETELSEVEEVQKQRGDAGMKLQEWMCSPDQTEGESKTVMVDIRQEGKMVAGETFERLNILSDCVWEIIASES
jgi:SET domain